jgi:GT2 family glycosyltransferase
MVPVKAPFVSFVVPLYNHLEQTQAMLESLQASLPANLDYEIILVDDASTDGTREWLQQLNVPRVHTILNPLNGGYARANNTGVALARGEILGLLNNDLLFEPGWLEPMLDILGLPALNAGLVGNVQVRAAVV